MLVPGSKIFSFETEHSQICITIDAGADLAQNLPGFIKPEKNLVAGKRKFFSLLGGPGGMLPQKILKIEALKSPEIAFQSNLLGNFFTITLVIFSHKMFYFYC